jgi:hypothetical protein
VRVMVLGGLSAAAGFLLLYTQLFVAYQGGTVSDVHAMCTSGVGALARGLNSTAASECSSVGGKYSTGMFLLWAGLALVAIDAFWYFARARNGSGAAAARQFRVRNVHTGELGKVVRTGGDASGEFWRVAYDNRPGMTYAGSPADFERVSEPGPHLADEDGRH